MTQSQNNPVSEMSADVYKMYLINNFSVWFSNTIKKGFNQINDYQTSLSVLKILRHGTGAQNAATGKFSNIAVTSKKIAAIDLD